MSTFELLALCILFFGIVIPAWMLIGGLYLLAKGKPRAAPVDDRATLRFRDYADTVNCILDELHKKENRAPVIIAALRNLHSFPEHKDATVLLLDEISVTGDLHFDQLLKRELVRLETSLLEPKNV